MALSRIQINRTPTPDNPPPNHSLLDGELSVEMANALGPRLWVGVPVEIDSTGRRNLFDPGTVLPVSGGTIDGDPGSLVIGQPTGGSMGRGTLNATDLYVNGIRYVSGATVSDTQPLLIQGALWYNSDNLQLYVGYDDGTSLQWVVASNDGLGVEFPIGISEGGTGATTASEALVNLGALPAGGGTISGVTPGSLVVGTPATGDMGPGTINATGIFIDGQVVNQIPVPVPVGQGGTGVQALTPNEMLPGYGIYNTIVTSYGTGLMTAYHELFGVFGVWNGGQAALMVGGEAARLELTRFNGALSAPTIVRAGDFIGRLSFNGYDGNPATGISPSSAAAQILGVSAADWSATDRGIALRFDTTLAGEYAPSTAMEIDGTGNIHITRGLVMDGAIGGNQGPGTINATNYYLNGVRFVGSAAIIADSPPAPSHGALWWDSTDLQLYVGYDDGNSRQWIVATNDGGGGGGGEGTVVFPVTVAQGGTGSTTAAGGLSNLGGLPLVGGTISGALVVSGALQQGAAGPNAAEQGIVSIRSAYNEIAAYGAGAGGRFAAIGHWSGTGFVYASGGDALRVQAEAAGGFIAFDTGATTTERMRIAADGTITIAGATAINAALSINAPGSNPLQATTPAGNNNMVRTNVTGARDWYFGAMANGNFSIYDNTAGRTPIYIDSNGTVFINSVPFTPNLPLAFSYSGKPLAGSRVTIMATGNATIPANLTGTVVYASTNATGNAVFTLNRIRAGSTTALGTITLGAGGAVTLAGSGGGIQAGDAVQMVAPGTQDGTLADVGITVLVTRTP